MYYNDFYYDGKYEEEYKQMNQTIIDGNVMNMSLIIIEGNYGAIDADDSTCYGYYYHIFFISIYHPIRLDY